MNNSFRRSLLVSTLGLSVLTIQDKFGLGSDSNGFSSLITVRFPDGVGPKEFLAQRESWGATGEFDLTVKAMSATGLLVSRTTEIGSHSAVFRLNFRNRFAHDMFVWKIKSQRIVNHDKLRELGYSFHRSTINHTV